MNPRIARALRILRRVLTGRAGLGLALSLASGCLVHGDRCAENQIESPGPSPTCFCAPGFIPDPRGFGCLACGPNEETRGDLCECKAGFARPTPEAACEQVPQDAGGCGDAACPDAAGQP